MQRASLLTFATSIAIVSPMNIAGYLEKHHLSQEAFAKLLGVSQGLVWQWIDGRTRVTAERAIDIEEKTGGEVTKHELRPDLYPDAPKRERQRERPAA